MQSYSSGLVNKECKMIGSSELFKHIPCPFGTDCQRPYCHFKHNPPPAEARVFQVSTTSDEIVDGAQVVICQEEEPPIQFDGYVGYVSTSDVQSDGSQQSSSYYNQPSSSLYYPNTALYNPMMTNPWTSNTNNSSNAFPSRFFFPNEPFVTHSTPESQSYSSACHSQLYAPEDPLQQHQLHNQHMQFNQDFHQAVRPGLNPMAFNSDLRKRPFPSEEQQYPYETSTSRMDRNDNGPPPKQKISNHHKKSKPPVYVPTPIAILEKQQQRKQQKNADSVKRKSVEEDKLEEKNKSLFPIDLAQDELLSNLGQLTKGQKVPKEGEQMAGAVGAEKKLNDSKTKVLTKNEIIPKKKHNTTVNEKKFSEPKEPIVGKILKKKTHVPIDSNVEKAKAAGVQKDPELKVKTDDGEKPQANLLNKYVKTVVEIDEQIQNLEKELQTAKKAGENTSKKRSALSLANNNNKIPIWRRDKKYTDVSKKPVISRQTNSPIDLDALFAPDEDQDAKEMAQMIDLLSSSPTNSPSSSQKTFYPKAAKATPIALDAIQKPRLSTSNKKSFLERMPVTISVSKAYVPKESSVPESHAIRASQSKKRVLPTPTEQLHLRTINGLTAAAATAEKLTSMAKEVCGSSTIKKEVSPSLPTEDKVKTIPSTVSKGESRRAHVPQVPFAPTSKVTKASTSANKVLIPLEPNSRKVPINVRQRHLQMIFCECQKIYESPDEALENAQQEEKGVLDKVSTRMGYISAIPNLIKRLRQFAGQNGSKNKCSTVSHKVVLAGRHAESITVGFNRSTHKDPLRAQHMSEADFYNALNQLYLLTEQQLWENGYPRWVDEESRESVEIKPNALDAKYKSVFVPDEEMRRICSRCGSEYRMRPDGEFATSTECVYHWGRAWKKRTCGSLETRYNCCDSDLTVKGCAVNVHHITQSSRLSTLSQYVETPRPFGVGDPRSRKVYAMDCEMIYTVWGPVVARLTVVDILEELVLDVIIRPEYYVVDCNTKFSGLTLEMVEKGECDLKEAQERLFELVNAETILIGHSLESDLRALRIVHRKVVDTSTVYPHRLGPPLKRALKTLASELIQLIIQEDETGHDSKEDAMACMKIMLRKVKEDR